MTSDLPSIRIAVARWFARLVHLVVGVVPGKHRLDATRSAYSGENHELHLVIKVVREAACPAGSDARLRVVDAMAPIVWRGDRLESPASPGRVEETRCLVSASLLDYIRDDVV
jgi:hypothetical protein